MIGYSNSIRSREVHVCTSEIFHRLTRSTYVARIHAELKDALEARYRGELKKEEYEKMKSELKKKLPIFTFHATFSDHRRTNKTAVPTGFSMYDIDHINAPRELFEEKIKRHLVEQGIVLAHVTPSGEGLRLVFRMPKDMNLAEAQKWMSHQLGDSEYDGSVKDMARSSFCPTEENILFIDEERLFAEKVEPLIINERKDDCDLSGRTSTDDTLPSTEVLGLEMSPLQGEQENDKSVGNQAPSPLERAGERLYRGIPYSDIIKEWFALTGGEPVEGDRNSRLFQLACELRFIAGSEELLLKILPNYGLSDEEMRSIVHSAMKEEYRSRYLSKSLRKAMENVECGMLNVELNAKADSDFNGTNAGNDGINSTFNIQHSTLNEPPAMPKKLPRLIALLESKTPEIYRPAVAHAVFPSLAAHLWRTRFKYIDGVDHEATLMNILMAGTGAGKSCIQKPIRYIMADIRKRDNENRERERAWKDEINRKGSNKDKRERPQGLVIQQVNPDMTNPAFVMRMKEAEEHFLYANMNELDQFDALRGSARQGGQFQIMCLSFDPENDYGQDRVGTQSVTENVRIRFNWNASTTVLKGQRYFSRVLTDGPISRINFCTIPEREIGADMPIYGEYDAAFEEELRPYIENLTKATGLVECREAVRLIMKLKDECADFARQSQSRVYENLSFRALVIAYLKACVLYVANGMKWEKTMDEFIRWSLNYDLWTKMHFFGTAIEAAEQDTATRTGSRGPRNLLTMLPEVFTLQQVATVRQSQGLSENGTKGMLKTWTHRGYIVSTGKDEWRKSHA